MSSKKFMKRKCDMCTETFYVKQGEPPPALYFQADKPYHARLCYMCAIRIVTIIKSYRKKREKYIA